MTDIKIKSKDGYFKFRACGILENNGRYLAVLHGDSDFYCFPGGHVQLNEDTDSAVCREMQEELGFEVEIVKLLAIVQNFFKENDDGLPFHELGYYYLMRSKNTAALPNNSFVRTEDDGCKLTFKWVTLQELEEFALKNKFHPHVLIDCIAERKAGHIIYRNS